MPTGFTTVSASHFQDATGAVIVNATIYFKPVDNNGNPISFLAGGAGGQVSAKSVQANVIAGAFSIVLADTTLTNPINVGYAVTCIDDLTGNELLGPGYACVQPSGSSWSFDTYVPTPIRSLSVWNSGVGGAIAGITFVDTVTGEHFNLTFAGGVETTALGQGDIGPPMSSLTFVDQVSSALYVMSFANGVKVIAS
jgi:hypothetical protein